MEADVTAATAAGTPVSDPRRWKALSVLAFMQFMLILDITVVNVALPSIQVSLGFTRTDLAWVVDAYVLVAGGFLLLGGRLADLLGRRRIFIAGVVVFAVASLTSGLAQYQWMLIISRAGQGFGEALAAPAALSIIVAMFVDPKERAKALGIWGGLAGLGGTVGVILSGIITQFASWRWIFLINLPIAALVLALLPRVVPNDRRRAGHGIDVAGALFITAGVSSLVYALLEANKNGWLSGTTIGFFVASAVLLAGFILTELKVAKPLIRLGFFRQRRPSASAVLIILVGSAFFSMFFLLTLYLQQVLGWSPLKSGMAYITFGVFIIAGFGSASQLLPRIGVRPVIVTGLVLVTMGFIWLARLPLDGHYWTDIAPSMMLIAFGSGWAFVSVTVAAVSQATDQEAGLASGLLTTAQQIGGALGLAVLVTVAAQRTTSLVGEGQTPSAAFVGGMHLAFIIGAGLVTVGALVALLAIGQFIPESLPTPLPVTEDAVG